MSDQFYTDIRDNVAADALTNFGVAVSLEYTKGKVFNGAVGEYTGGSTAKITTKGLLKNYKASEVDGELIKRDDLLLLCSASDFAKAKYVPAIGDTVTAAGLKYRVMNVQPVAPGGVAVLYRLQLRG